MIDGIAELSTSFGLLFSFFNVHLDCSYFCAFFNQKYELKFTPICKVFKSYILSRVKSCGYGTCKLFIKSLPRI